MGVAFRMPQPRRFTVEEYLTIERKAASKSEFHMGQILARPSATVNHCAIPANVSGSLWPHLRGRNCRMVNSDLRTAVAGGAAIYYPDVSLICGKPKFHSRHRDVISNPGLVVEVLSRSTSRYDRLVKVPLYQRTPSVNDILLVAQDRARVEHISRNAAGWKTVIHSGLAATIELAHLDCRLALADVYVNIKV